MKTLQKNKSDMLRATRAVLSAATETIEDTGLAAAFAAFITKTNHIDRLVAAQSVPLSGIVADRDDAFEQATLATLRVAGRVLAYATAHRLGDLATRVRVVPGRFRSMRFRARLTLMQQVHETALAMLPQLAEVGVAAAMLTEFKAAIDAAEAVQHTPRTTVVARKVTTEQLAEAFKDMDLFLTGQLDPMMIAVQKTNPTLYAAYQGARRVIDRPGHPAVDEDEQRAGMNAPKEPAILPSKQEQPLAA